MSFHLPFPSALTPPWHDDGFTLSSSYLFDAPSSSSSSSSSLASLTTRRHARSPSVRSAASTAESTPDSVSTCFTTPPPRSSPPVHHRGPVLLPKIRQQDHLQHTDPCHKPEPPRAAAAAGVSPLPADKSGNRSRGAAPARASSARPIPSSRRMPTPGYADPETLAKMAYAHLSSLPGADALHEPQRSSPSPVGFPGLTSGKGPGADMMTQTERPENAAVGGANPRHHTPTCFGLDADPLAACGYPAYGPSSMTTPPPGFPLSCFPVGGQSPPLTTTTTTTLISYLTAPNPAASLVRTISFPARDPAAKHFWWDTRTIRPWTTFTAQSILALPNASALLTTPLPTTLLPSPGMPDRAPETESSLHAIYAAYYLPKLNAALALSSSTPRPLRFSVPPKSTPAPATRDLLFVANPPGEPPRAATLFGGKPPLARLVGLVLPFDRFNTAMRLDSNIRRVEYLRGLAALHHAMRLHSSRYGFVLTEIELVVVRSGTDPVPFFGHLQLLSVPLSSSDPDPPPHTHPRALTACLALWGLCQLAADEPPPGHPHWRTHIGAPAEGTRRKARPRDAWMPQPQLAEKRQARRSRGWIWPEDAVGGKELGKRGVRYCAV